MQEKESPWWARVQQDQLGGSRQIQDPHVAHTGVSRLFSTGATRDTDTNKPDYDGYLSPLVIRRFGQYMAKHQVQSDGTLRASDNWQKGIPPEEYRKSLWRHTVDFWTLARGWAVRDVDIEDAACGIMFNIMGWLHERLKASEQNRPAEVPMHERPDGF